MLKLKSLFIDLLIIEVIALCITIIWFHQGLLYGGGEGGLPFYNLTLTLKTTLELWQNSYLGFPSIYQINSLPLYYFANALYSLGLPGFLIQSFLHFLLFSIGMVSIYFLLQITINREFKYRFLPFFGALFYFLNLYSMSQVWTRGLYMQFIPFASFPLMLLLMQLALSRKKVIFILFTLIFSFIFSAGFTPAYVLSFWLMMGVLFIYHFISQKEIKFRLNIIAYFILLFAGWVVIHSWWLANLILLSNTLYLSNEAVTNEGLGTLMAVSKYSSFFSVVRLIQDGYFNGPWLYGSFYQTIFFQILSWVIPILALFSLSEIKKSKSIKFFIILFLFSMFICLGANFPLGFLFVWLFNHFPILQLFRNPYEKFGIVLLISYTPFVILGFLKVTELLHSRYKKFGRYISGALFLTMVGILVWPMWTGLVIRTIDSKNLVKVPTYFNELSKWMDQNNKIKNRIFMLPFMPGEGTTYIWGGKVYSGLDPMVNILDYSVISFTAGSPYQKDLLKEIYQDIGQLDVSNMIGLLRAKYLVIRDDLEKVEKRDLKQEGYFFDHINSPNDNTENMPSVCINQSIKRTTEKEEIAIACQIPDNQSDWSKYKYLHLIVRTDKPAALDIAIRDQNQQRPRWVDNSLTNDYKTNSSDWTDFTLDLNLAVYGAEKFDNSKVVLFEVLARPNLSYNNLSSVDEVDVKGAYLDEGQETKVDNYQFIDKFGKLRLYQLKKYLDFPDVNILSDIRIVDQSTDMLNDAKTLTKVDGQTGYIVKSQNNNFTPFPNFSLQQLLMMKKVSEYKYLINVGDQSNQYLVLHKTFNPMWKVIPDISEQDLDGSIISDINLFKKQTLGENNHFIVNGYANLWKIEDGDKKYAIIFLPQIISDILLRISLAATGFITLIIIINLFKSKFFK